jgi:glucose/arabinose dehydrogenase
MRGPTAIVLGCLVLLGGASAYDGAQAVVAKRGGNWTRFGYDAARHNAGPVRTGITAANVGRLRGQRVSIGGTADSSPIYLRGALVAESRHDLFVVTTSYGKAVAVDARTGTILWRFVPGGYASWAGTEQITNSSPLASDNRRFVFTASPDGRIHKLSVATGREVRAGSWPVSITRNPRREKIGPALNLARGLVLATTGGYIGDAPPYQGHVVSVDASTGRISHVWNALCSDRRGLILPSSCSESGAAIWARSGVVVVPGTGRLLVATGDGRWNGRTFWGDSVLMLSPDASRLLQNWTPSDQAELDTGDVDLGSTAPALLSARYAVQGGKDAKLRLLDLRGLNGRGSAGAITGGEVQTVGAPGGSGVFTAPAVWRNGGQTWLFVTSGSGTAAFTLERGRLRSRWRKPVGGTSPVVAGGLLYVFDPDGGKLNVYTPRSGRRVVSLRAGHGHWSSPIVIDGRVALPTGDANDHSSSGTLIVYRLPTRQALTQKRTAVQWRLVSSELTSPDHVAATKSQPNRLYVVEQGGAIRVLLRGKLLARPFLDISSIVKSGGEQGLLSVAFHPRFARNRLFYVDYTNLDGDTRVVEYRANRRGTRGLSSTARRLVAVAQPYANHNGGQVAFGPDGYLYVGMGDGGSGGDPENRAQNLGSKLGKLLRINVAKRGAVPEIVGYGLRNPWRFSFDRSTGDLYIGDVGQNRWEEIDFLPRRSPGLENYGWDVYEGTAQYETKAPNPAGHLVSPVYVYGHGPGCSVTGGFVYRGKKLPASSGHYVFGDYCSGQIWSLRVSGGKATDVHQEGQRLPQLSSFGEDARGELYAVTLDGRLYRLTG